MSKVEKIKSVHLEQSVLKIARKKNLNRVDINAINTVFEKPKDDEIVGPTVQNPLFLKERIETIQKLKKDLGIENQAAMTGLEILGAGAAIVGLIKGVKAAYDWFTSSGVDDQSAQLASEAIESLGENWSIDLYGINPDDRNSAIKKLAEAKLDDPKKIVDKVLKGLKGLHDKSFTEQDVANVNKSYVRGLFSALEALYQRSDTQEDLRESCQWLIQLLEKSGKFQLIDEASEECMRRILVNNWKVPVKDYKVPTSIGINARSKTFREGIYKTIYSIILKSQKENEEKSQKDDPFFLSTPTDDVPYQLQSKVKELKEALVKAYNNEVRLESEDKGNHSFYIVETIGKILTSAKDISPLEWSEAAKEHQAKAEANERVFNKFNEWASKVPQISEEQLQNCFEAFVREYEDVPAKRKDDKYLDKKRFESWLDNDLNQLKQFFQKERYIHIEELNGLLSSLWKHTNLGSNHPSEKLTYRNYEKGLFFFRYFHELLNKKISIGGNPPVLFKDLLSEKNKSDILKVCKTLVHDTENFPEVERNYGFFTEPNTYSVPGLALALHHKLSWHINEENGYVDLYDLRKQVLENSVRSLYPKKVMSGSKRVDNVPGISSFLFSGPPGTGKSSFAEALANQLAIQIFVLKPSMVVPKDGGVVIKYNGTEVPINSFFNIVNKQTPCILLIDEADEILPPSKKQEHNKEEKKEGSKIRSGLFISELEKRGDQGLSPKVVSIMTTNFPLTENIDVSSINENGYSGDIEKELYNYIDQRAIREGRADKKIFTFHKLYSEGQGAILAERFLSPYVEAGVIIGSVNYKDAGKTVMKYAPGTIEKVFADTVNVATGEVTQELMINELKKHPSLVRLHADSQTVIDIEGVIKALQGLKVKKVEGSLDFQKLAIHAKGLNYDQILDTIMSHTPETLTQENIIAAFEQVRKSAS